MIRNIFLFAFFILLSLASFLFSQNSLAQQNQGSNSSLVQSDLPDKTSQTQKNSVYKLSNVTSGTSSLQNSGAANRSESLKGDAVNDTTKSGTTNSANKKPAIDKSQLLDAGSTNIFTHTNDLVSTLLGNGKITSLMFDDEEIANIDRALESFKNNETFTLGQDPENVASQKDPAKEIKTEEENEKSYIYLASIIYYSPKDWAVWINNLKITSETNKNNKELFVKEISHDHAKIIWYLSISKWKILSGKKSEDLAPKLNAKNNVEIEFTLRPNQTFILSSGRVVEGRAVVNIAKEKESSKEKVNPKK